MPDKVIEFNSTTMPLKCNATLGNEHQINTSQMQLINLQLVLLVNQLGQLTPHSASKKDAHTKERERMK